MSKTDPRAWLDEAQRRCDRMNGTLQEAEPALAALRAVLDLCDRSNRPNATKLLHPGDVRRVIKEALNPVETK